MKNIIKCSYLGFLLLLLSCNKTKEPQQAAQEYCDCMKGNESNIDYTRHKKALKICGDLLYSKYKYYRINIDLLDSAKGSKIPYSENHESAVFMNSFYDYLRKNCTTYTDSGFKSDTTSK